MRITNVQLQAGLVELTDYVLRVGRPYPKPREQYLAATMYATDYKLYDLSRGQQLAVAAANFSFKAWGRADQARFWSYAFANTPYLVIGQLAIDHFRAMKGKKNQNLAQYWPLLKKWVPKIDNWVHGDMLAGVLNQIYSERHEEMDPQLQQWLSSRSPWKQRMALLTLFYYHNAKRYQPPATLVTQALQPLLDVDHYYLQKAVGWTLREFRSAHPDEADAFLEDHLHRITPTAYSTAVERLPKRFKQALNARRALRRQQERAEIRRKKRSDAKNESS